MKVWLTVGSDDDGAWLDGDCIFEYRTIAEDKAAQLRESHKGLNFSVIEVDVPDSKEDAIYAIADSIRANADAMMSFSDNVKEFVTCACSNNGQGGVATNPTIVIKKGE